MKAVLLIVVLALLVVVPYVLSLHPSGQATYAVAPQFSAVGSGATWHSGRWWPFWITGPLVRLDVYDWGIRIGGPDKMWLSWIAPRVELAWPELAYAERRPTGLRLVRADDQRRTILFNGHRDELIESLSRFPVDFR
jgi:hypothetical protein